MFKSRKTAVSFVFGREEPTLKALKRSNKLIFSENSEDYEYLIFQADFAIATM